jgi:UDP-N-acetyl-2-amino-2-deoxyglucuronate dehydrogenase
VSAAHGVGIVGAGLIFEHHAQALAELGDRARIVGLCELDAERLRAAAARHKVGFACRDHRGLLARPDIELVAVCTPPSLHEQVVVDALRAGKHVICEKPLAPTLAGADRIIAVASEFPGRLSVAYQFRYLPSVRRTRWLLESGALGSLLSGHFHRFARFQRPGKPPRSRWWGRWDVAGGGAVMTQLIHELDLMRMLFGTPAEAWAVADTLKEPIESEDTCAAVVRFCSGAICSAQATMCAHRSTAGFDVFGTRGSAHSPWRFECLDREQRDELRRAVADAVPDRPEEPEPCPHTPYLEDVLDALDAGQPLPCGPQEARASLELATAIYASSLTGEAALLPIAPDHRWYEGIAAGDYRARPHPHPEVTVAG